MSDSTSPPPVFPPEALREFYILEHSFWVGNYVSAIIYGISLVVYFATMRHLVQGPTETTKRRRWLGIYSTVMFILLTIDLAVNAFWFETLWINSRAYPGGVHIWMLSNINVWYQCFGSTTVVAMIFMGDAFLIYRLFLLYGSDWRIIVLPLLAYVTAFILGVIELVHAFVPEGNFFKGSAVNWGIPYYSITISLNIIVTLLLVFRILRLARAAGAASLTDDAVKMYTSVAAMLIESAAPYSILGFMFLIPYSTGSPTAISFGQAWAKSTFLAPQLIILRVVKGRAWSHETVAQTSRFLDFSTSGEKGSGDVESVREAA